MSKPAKSKTMKPSIYNVYSEELPELVIEIAGLIGLPRTLRLIANYGGQRKWFADKIKAEGALTHWLVECVGLPQATELTRYFAGTYLILPRCAEALRRQRNREIQARYDNGEGVNALAKEYSLTTRQIRKILTMYLESSTPVTVGAGGDEEGEQLEFDV